MTIGLTAVHVRLTKSQRKIYRLDVLKWRIEKLARIENCAEGVAKN
jgi:hypothetical protein